MLETANSPIKNHPMQKKTIGLFLNFLMPSHRIAPRSIREIIVCPSNNDWDKTASRLKSDASNAKMPLEITWLVLKYTGQKHTTTYSANALIITSMVK